MNPQQRKVEAKAIEMVRNHAYLEVEGYSDLLTHETQDSEESLKNGNWWRRQWKS